MLAKNFRDARKHGDGERIVMLYKFMLLYFRIDGRTKYTFQTLHFLSQVSFLLPPALAHELTWNRFVNTKGKIDSNIEIDRHLEHRNKYAKADLAHYQGKITKKSVDRCSRSYQKIQELLDVVDEELAVEKSSGRHTMVDPHEDVLKLAEQYQIANIFGFVGGRFHTKFPGFPSSYLTGLNILEFKHWIFDKLTKFKQLNIYQQDNIYT